jgi:ABC-2 type transport system permease protein
MTDVLVESVRERRRSLLWWSLGLIGLIGINLAFYPSVRDDPALSDFARDLPESVRGLFAGGELDIASPSGYLNSQVYALAAPLVLLIFSIGAGAGAVAGEEERGTLDLLLAHPIRRRGFALQRFLAVTALVAALTLVLLASVAIGCRLVDLELGFDRLLVASAAVGLLALLFGAVALAVGAIRPGRTTAIAVAAGLAVASWLLDGLGRSVDVLDTLRPFSPYYQALGRNPLSAGGSWVAWTYLVLATALCALAAAAGLERRDIRQ